MTAKQGVLILTAALLTGAAVGYVLGVYHADQVNARTAARDDVRQAWRDTASVYMEELLRKGGPPTPEAMNGTTETPATTDADAAERS